MAEYEELVPGCDGDIVTEIQAGKLSRRNFLMATGFAGLGVFGGVRALGTLTGKTPIIADAKGVLMHRPERCVACRRCELACTEFNDGAGSAYLARVKVGRTMNFGPAEIGRAHV
jgi:ferredoxin